MSRTTSEAKAKDWQYKAKTKDLEPKAKDMVNWPRGSSRPVDHVLEDSISVIMMCFVVVPNGLSSTQIVCGGNLGQS